MAELNKSLTGSGRNMLNTHKDTPAGNTASAAIHQLPSSLLAPHPLIAALFPPVLAVKARLIEEFKNSGFGPQYPPLIGEFDGNRILICDGITRLAAAVEAELTELPVMITSFADDFSRIAFAVKNNHARPRQLIRAMRFRVVEAVTAIEDAKAKDWQTHQTAFNSVPRGANRGQANAVIGKLIGISTDKVHRIRCVSTDPELRQMVIDGKLSVNTAFRQLRPQARAPIQTCR